MNDPSEMPPAEGDYERRLREMNEALLISSIRQHELTEQAQEAEAKLRQSEARLAAELAVAQRRQTLFDSILSSVHDFVYVFDREGRFTYANRTLLELWGLRPQQALGRTMADLNYPKEVEQQLLSDVRQVVETGQVVMSVTHYTNPAGASSYYENVLAPVPSAEGLIELIVGSSRDITDRKQAEETQRLLLGELNHRVKNMLAMIQAIAQQTLRTTSSPEQFVASFSGRLQALARVHTLLTQATWQGADLRELIGDQVLLGPIDERRLTHTGPSIKLEPQMALHMAMVLHELATNSFKYGALSGRAGSVTVSWTVEDRELQLQWLERGGPTVEKTASRGFGTKMIEDSVKAHQGSAEMIRDAQGVSWTIVLPLPVETAGSAKQRSFQEAAASSAAADVPGHAANGGDAPLTGRRVLVVEDEPLVSLDLVCTMEEAGIRPIGPASSAEAALRLIDTEHLDAALVDANLRGRPVDEIAAALTRRGVPFAFVTGYARGSLPSAFNGVPMLAKPHTQEALLHTIQTLIVPQRKVSTAASHPPRPSEPRLEDS